MIHTVIIEEDSADGLDFAITEFFDGICEDDLELEIVSCSYQAFKANRDDHLYSALILYKVKKRGPQEGTENGQKGNSMTIGFTEKVIKLLESMEKEDARRVLRVTEKWVSKKGRVSTYETTIVWKSEAK